MLEQKKNQARRLIVGVIAACLLAGMATVMPSASAAAITAPTPLWSHPLSGSEGQPIATPGGNVLALSQEGPGSHGSLQAFTPDGARLWQLPESHGVQPMTHFPTAMDAVGNTYVGVANTSTGQYFLKSVDAAGHVRWTTAPLPVECCTSIAVGWDGNVYVGQSAGYGENHILGFDQKTGKQVHDFGDGDVSRLVAYKDGLIIVERYSVRYLRYDGTLIRDFAGQLNAGISFSSASGGSGRIFIGGYTTAPDAATSSCFQPSVRTVVQELTPTGVAWTWRSTHTIPCAGVTVASTPDGGVIVNDGYRYASISSSGGTRWEREPTVAKGSLSTVGIPTVDRKGNVMLSLGYNGYVNDPYNGVQVDFVTQTSDKPLTPPLTIEATDCAYVPNALAGIYSSSVASGPGRLYVTLRTSWCGSSDPPYSGVIRGFDAPGLDVDYAAVVDVPAASQPPPPTPFSYVALGDSYSSGEGVSPYRDGTDVNGDRCHRSSLAYPLRSANVLKFYGDFFSFHACSGAKIQDFTSANTSNHEPAQLNWLNKQTHLVTLTIGGNDAYFADVMQACVGESHTGVSCKSLWQNRVDSKIKEMGNTGTSNSLSLYQLYRKIKNKAPNAKILVLGYPRIFPQTPPHSCGTGFGNSFTQSQMQWLNAEIKNVDSVIEGAAKKAGVTYVAAYDIFKGHELCTSDPYVNKGIPGGLNALVGSFHPNVNGQNALAKLVQANY